MITFENNYDFESTKIFEKIQFHMSLVLGAATVATTIAVYTSAISLVSIPVLAVGVAYSAGTLIEFAMDVYRLLKKTVISLASEVYGDVIDIFNAVKTTVNKTVDVVKSVFVISTVIKTVKSTVIKPVDAVKSGFVKSKEFVKSGFDKFRSWFSS